jgi:predicted kinase
MSYQGGVRSSAVEARAGGRSARDAGVYDDGYMSENAPARSVKISADERTGWSSERPRRDGAAPRPVNVSVRSRVLAPSDRMRYSPGSLVVVVGAAASEPARFVDRVVEERSAALSLTRVRALLAGRVDADEIEPRAQELLAAAVLKRLQAGQSVALAVEGFDAAERERYVRLAHGLQRPRHLILLEAPRDQVLDEERPSMDELRRRLDAGELGLEGFQTALRLGGPALAELKRVVFQRPPRED